MTVVPEAASDGTLPPFRLIICEPIPALAGDFGDIVSVEAQVGVSQDFPETMLDAYYDRAALIYALLPEDVRDYLLYLVEDDDGGDEEAWGYHLDVRDRAIALLWTPAKAAEYFGTEVSSG